MLGEDPGRRGARSASGSASCCRDRGFYPHVTVSGGGRALGRHLLKAARPQRGIGLVGLQATRRMRARAASGGQLRRLDLAWRSSATPSWCSWTSRQPASTPPHGARRGTPSGRCPARQDDPVDNALPRRGQTLADRVGDHPRRPDRRRRRPERARRRRATRYRVRGASQKGQPVEQETEDPTELLHSRPGRRSTAASGCGASVSAAEPRGGLPRADPERRRPTERGSERRALIWRQYRVERRMFWRNPSAAFFNFALPLIFLALSEWSSTPTGRAHVIVPGDRRDERDGDDVLARSPST